MDPQPFLRGTAFGGTERVPYPRAKPDDAGRLPLDTWMQAQVPAGIRLEFTGEASEIEIAYETRTDKLGYRGDGAGTTFQLWRDGALVSEERAALGAGSVRLKCAAARSAARAIVYLPEGMKPVILDVVSRPDGATLAPAPSFPRWVAYGDSIAEGWSASCPALAWTATVAREHDLDLVNMGYAGAARGEIVSAEHIAEMRADLISITHGTNCWNRIPFSVAMIRSGLHAFLDVVRQGHPHTPVVVCSPLLRPEAETTPNRLGATLGHLRDAMEEVVHDRIGAGDAHLLLVEGKPVIEESMLADATHPNDDGHRAIADALGPVLAGKAA